MHFPVWKGAAASLGCLITGIRKWQKWEQKSPLWRVPWFIPLHFCPQNIWEVLPAWASANYLMHVNKKDHVVLAHKCFQSITLSQIKWPKCSFVLSSKRERRQVKKARCGRWVRAGESSWVVGSGQPEQHFLPRQHWADELERRGSLPPLNILNPALHGFQWCTAHNSPLSSWISVSAAWTETRLGREPRTHRSHSHGEPHLIQPHTSTLSQETEGLQLLPGSSNSSVIRGKKQIHPAAALKKKLPGCKSSNVGSSSWKHEFPCQHLMLLSLHYFSYWQGCKLGFSSLGVQCHFGHPQVAAEFAQHWQGPGPATGGQVGEHRTSQTASQLHDR